MAKTGKIALALTGMALLAGCSSSYSSSAADPVVGPGPQPTYSVQPQPAPGTCHYKVLSKRSGKYLPDPSCTPGAISPAVTQDNLADTICKPGYTASIRPPESITGPEKAASELAYSFSGNASTTEYDHLVSLELGGDPNDPRNLWPEPNKTRATSFSNPKDAVENQLHALVCNAVSGKAYLPLTIAQDLIASDWTTAVAQGEKDLVNYSGVRGWAVSSAS